MALSPGMKQHLGMAEEEKRIPDDICVVTLQTLPSPLEHQIPAHGQIS
jgi:hypothetical protein